jgi:hypothetical protein
MPLTVRIPGYPTPRANEPLLSGAVPKSARSIVFTVPGVDVPVDARSATAAYVVPDRNRGRRLARRDVRYRADID